jgi:hypothetical protein
MARTVKEQAIERVLGAPANSLYRAIPMSEALKPGIE